MKTVISIPVFLFFATLFSACEKDFQCECTIPEPGGATTYASFIIHGTRTEAETRCDRKAQEVAQGTAAFCTIMN